MAFTIDQYNTLSDAISSGTLKVKYADKEVEYRSLDEMLRIQAIMQAELSIAPKTVRRKYASVCNGINPRYTNRDEHYR